MSQPVFSRRMAIGLGVVGALSFLGSLIFAMRSPEVREAFSHQADSFSRSAIGHHALVRLLEEMGTPVTVSRFATGERASAGSVLVLLEPDVTAAGELPGLADLIKQTAADRLVVVLPKWRAVGGPDEEGFARQVAGRSDPADVLRALGLDLELRPGGGAWQSEGLDHQPRLVEPRQVLVGAGLRPLLSDGVGALAAEVEAFDHTILLIADPDLLNNAGILQGDNAQVVLDLLAPVIADRSVLVDETLHGFAAPEGIWARLLDYPLVVVTLQAAVVVALMLWAGMRRFGAVTPLPSALGRGRRVLVENTAHLLWFGGHSPDALSRYWSESLRATAERLHAPLRLDPHALRAWLDGVGKSRHLPQTTADLDEAVARAGHDGPRMLAAARRIHRWRTAMSEHPPRG